ncbi:P-loop containing nucleoside triphosphate hydrolase protein [Leucogyrophana mollusca]|uniref:P-loop containing nucleoside triphosphate hydrolase protein n=1 Tax=Leucogyrophana mollusca TaxID=85980 RepID=A0ACB8BU37_9AGAM|nr:P-loop containing nucleoside triphosphate hydrolase protein [Leucogyrophana mollusca]
MAEKRKPRTARNLRAKTSTVSQRSLLDIFQKNERPQQGNASPGGEPLSNRDEGEIDQEEHVDVITIEDDPEPYPTTAPTSPPIPPPVALATLPQTRQNQLPKKLYSIFEKKATVPMVIDVDAFDVEITSVPPPVGSLRKQSPSLDSSLLMDNSLSFPIAATASDVGARAVALSIRSTPEDISSLTSPTRIFVKAEAPSPYKKPTLAHPKVSDAPYPDQHSQHVRGPQNTYTHTHHPVKRRVLATPTPVTNTSLSFLSSIPASRHPTAETHRTRTSPMSPPPTSPTQTGKDQYLAYPFLHHANFHPAIARLINNTAAPFTESSPHSQRQEMWTTRWRPRRADEVLGNEHHAVYIRNWFQALALQFQGVPIIPEPTPKNSQAGKGRPKGKSKGTEPPERGIKRRRVIRAVTNKKGRKRRRIDSEDELDDFIASSDGNADDYLSELNLADQSEDELEFCRQTFSRIHRIGGDLEATEAAAESEAQPLHHDATEVNSNPRCFDVDFAENLTNTLLITGPPGCGKTAAVYACAEELGWEVFEVYPGIGRRNSANLDRLVGDVGKNHLIQKAQPRASTSSESESISSSAFAALFGKCAKVVAAPCKALKRSGTEDQPIEIQADSPVNFSSEDTSHRAALPVSPVPPGTSTSQTAPLVESTPVPTATRQSVVLLEEVDILFKEDAGFWPAVIELIRECKRPVIMTCNDIRLVPLADLPLQATLAFEPCPSPEAVSYLQGLCFAEGCPVPRESLASLYDMTYPTEALDIPDAPPNPRTERLPLADLRRTITQLQLMCSLGADAPKQRMPHGDHEVGMRGRPPSPVISVQTSAYLAEGSQEEKERWLWFARHTDLVSSTDSHLCRAPQDTPEALSFNMCEPSLDDELGHSILFRPSHVSDTSDALAFYHNDELIAQEAIRLSRGAHAAVDTDPIVASINPAASGSFPEHRLFHSRVVYESQMVEALQHIINLPAPLMPQRSVFLDYIPWVREMVTVDDILERLAWDGMEKEKSGRMTRNSMKAKHARSIELSADQRRLLDATRLENIEADVER